MPIEQDTKQVSPKLRGSGRNEDEFERRRRGVLNAIESGVFSNLPPERQEVLELRYNRKDGKILAFRQLMYSLQQSGRKITFQGLQYREKWGLIRLGILPLQERNPSGRKKSLHGFTRAERIDSVLRMNPLLANTVIAIQEHCSPGYVAKRRRKIGLIPCPVGRPKKESIA